MLPVHLAIGLVEGVVTAIVVNFIRKADPEIFSVNEINVARTKPAMQKVIIGLVAVTLVTGGIVSWFASAHPDGLEWSISKITGREEMESPLLPAVRVLLPELLRLLSVPLFCVLLRRPAPEKILRPEEMI